MLDAMRKKAQGWIAAFIVGILALAFALWGIQYYVSSHAGGEVVAKVDGTDITSYQVNKAYGQLRQQMMVQMGDKFPTNPEFQKMMRRNALQSLINRTVLTQEANKFGIHVNDRQVIDEIRNNPAFQEDAHFSPARMQQIMRAFNLSEEELFNQIRDSIIMGQLQQGIQFTAFALPKEVSQAVQLSEQERSFKYFIIPTQLFSHKINVSDAQAKAYYEKNKNKFMDPMKVRLEYLELDLDHFRNKIKPTAEQLKEFYEENKNFFSTPRQWEVTHWKIHLPENPSHEQIVAAKSQLEHVQKENGDPQTLHKFTKTTEWVTATKDNSELIKRLAKLKPGQFGGPFATEKNIEMVKLLAVKQPQVTPFEKAQAQVKEQFIRHEVEREFVEASDQLSELVYTNPDNLIAASDELGVKVKTTDYFSQSGGNDRVTKNPKVLKEAFSEEVLLDGNNSSVIEIESGHLLVLRVKDKVDAKPKPFPEVKSEIVKTLRDQEAGDKVKQLGEKLIQQLRDKKSIVKLMSQNKLTWKQEKSVTRKEQGGNPDALLVAFKAPNPANTESPSVRGKVTEEGDFVVVQLEKVHDRAKVDLTEQHQKVLADRIAMGYGKLEFDLFVKSLMDGANIRVLKQY